MSGSTGQPQISIHTGPRVDRIATTQPKERPILFSGPMVRAILEGRKTQTRRPVKQPNRRDGAELDLELLRSMGVGEACPYGAPGDRLWVRETWYCDHSFAGDYEATERGYLNRKMTREECEAEWRGSPEGGSLMYYRADVPSGRFEDAGYWGEPGGGWRPSIHMPRWASRITLEVTGVRVERLHQISEADALAEGIGRMADTLESTPQPTFGAGGIVYGSSPVEAFETLWCSINGEASWGRNPWVWVVEFRKISEPGRMLQGGR